MVLRVTHRSRLRSGLVYARFVGKGPWGFYVFMCIPPQIIYRMGYTGIVYMRAVVEVLGRNGIRVGNAGTDIRTRVANKRIR
jgi:hypothetical protein